MRRSRRQNSGSGIGAGSGGFTLVELLTVVAIIAVIAVSSLPTYQYFVNKAKMTVAKHTLHDVQRILESFNGDTGAFPATIDFTTGLDEQGRTVFQAAVLNQIATDLFSVDSYVVVGNSYTLRARAKNFAHTVLVLTPQTLLTEE